MGFFSFSRGALTRDFPGELARVRAKRENPIGANDQNPSPERGVSLLDCCDNILTVLLRTQTAVSNFVDANFVPKQASLRERS
jgi:hypothetical protein